uniref:Uncharacterized protein n=1 Tax=Gossypium raimondii TaxID=29730 RepID=A0A0D2V3Y5_GOSRA|nr:hypothetical protein B456_012G086700 [Gossypium raimondii]
MDFDLLTVQSAKRRLCRHEARKTSARTALGLAGLLTEAKPYQTLRYEPPKAKPVPWIPRTINVRSTNMKDKTGARRHVMNKAKRTKTRAKARQTTPSMKAT